LTVAAEREWSGYCETAKPRRYSHEPTWTLRSDLGSTLHVAQRRDFSFGPLSEVFLGRTDNIAIRSSAAVALLFNVLMVIVAIIAIATTVPRDDPKADERGHSN